MSKAETNLRTVGIFVTIAGVATAVRMLSEHKPWEVYTFPDKLLSTRFPKQPTESDQETSTRAGPRQRQARPGSARSPGAAALTPGMRRSCTTVTRTAYSLL